MEWKDATNTGEGLVKIPKRWLHIHYYEALNILFRFENSLRVFVYSILKNEFLNEWKDCSFAINEGDSKSIKGIAKQRIKQSESFGYLGFDITAPLMHLTSGELVELIVSESYWPKFKSHFRGNKEIIKNKLLEIGNIRNSLAHFRPIKPEDIGLVKQNSRHTLIGVEECLKNVFNQGLRVPTNTQEEWYKSISTLGTEQTNTILYYSENEHWVCVKLHFTSPIFTKQSHGDAMHSYTLGKINTPNILILQKELSKLITYVSEKLNYPVLSEIYDMEVSKDINLVFRKDVLIDNYETISTEIKEILSIINDECELLRQDNLARGKLVESAQTWAIWSKSDGEEGKWTYYYDQLEQKYLPTHPDEYWGQLASSNDVVAGCHRYPWMPADISTVEGWND